MLAKLANHLSPKLPAYAFFDFDGTLTHTDSVLPFLRMLADNDVDYWRKLLCLSPYLLGYVAGCVSNLTAKEKLFGAFLAGKTQAAIEKAVRDFVVVQLPELLRPVGMSALATHRARGDCCVLVSASPELYLQQWAYLHGFSAVIGTRLAMENGVFTGKVAGENCIGAEKVHRIEAMFGQTCWQGSYAYSDSKVDWPMLCAAEQGFLLRRGVFIQI